MGVEGDFESGFFSGLGGSKSTSEGGVGTTSDEIAKRFAFLDSRDQLRARSTDCDFDIRDNSQNEDNTPLNCGKLNFANAHFHPGPQTVKSDTGTFKFVSTRNNNFSNRNQKGAITVTPGPSNLSAG